MVPGCWGTHMASLRDRQNMEMLGLMRSSGGFSICLKEMSPANSMFRKLMWDIPTYSPPRFPSNKNLIGKLLRFISTAILDKLNILNHKGIFRWQLGEFVTFLLQLLSLRYIKL